MDKLYILPKLIKWAELFYGEKKKPYCFAKKKGGGYRFGWKKGKKEVSNKLSEQVAMYLCVPITVQKSEITEEEVLKVFKKFLKNQTSYQREKILHKFSKFVKKKK